MKFYPLKNWRKGQDTVVINKGKYYTLEGATDWELNKEEEDRVTLAAHEGEQWLKKWGDIPPVVAGKIQKDKAWIRQLLTSEENTAIVSSQPEIVLVAPTPPAHQDAGSITLDPTARKQAESKKGAGGKKGKVFRTSPPVTRSRKRTRNQNPNESRTASQDSCTPRNLTTSTEHGYTPPPAGDLPKILAARNGETDLKFIRKLLDLHKEEFDPIAEFPDVFPR